MLNVAVHKVITKYNRQKSNQSKHNYIKTSRVCVSKIATCFGLRLVILKLATILHDTHWGRQRTRRSLIANRMVCQNRKSYQYHLGDPGVDGRIILRWIFRKWHVGGMDWIELAQDKDRCRALVNVVMKLRLP